jgi:hypothetical protein
MFVSQASQRKSTRPGARIALSIARSQSDLEEAFGLVYRSYLRAGLDSPNPTGLRLTRHHFLPTTDVMLARNAGVPIATASLIVDGELGLPAEAIYGEEILRLKKRGLRLAEIGSLADRRESPVRFIQMFRNLSALIAQAAYDRGCNALVATTHPRHARFYIRQIGFEPFGEIRACPYAKGNPAMPLLLDIDQHRRDDTEIYRFQFRNKFTKRELEPFHWPVETRVYFEEIMRRMSEPTKVPPPAAPTPPQSPIETPPTTV